MQKIFSFVIILWLLATMGLAQTSVPRIIKPKDTLRVGVHNFKPFAFKENGKWRGLEVDAIQNIADELGVKIKYQEYSFPDCFRAIETNKADVIIAGISVTAEREAWPYLKFSHPTITSGLGILERSGDKPSAGEQLLSMGSMIVKAGSLTLIVIVVLPSICALFAIRYMRPEQKDEDESPLKVGLRTIWSYKDAFFERYWFFVGMVTTWGNGPYFPSRMKIRYLSIEYVVYNRKRVGRFKLAGLIYYFQRPPNFPKKNEVTDEYLFVDLLNNYDRLPDPPDTLWNSLKRRAKEFPYQNLARLSQTYGKASARKLLKELTSNG